MEFKCKLCNKEFSIFTEYTKHNYECDANNIEKSNDDKNVLKSINFEIDKI